MAHILIVEESSHRTGLLQAALRGHRLVCTKTARQALNLMQTMTFDLLVAPIYFEHEDIFSLVRRASELDHTLRIVLYSIDRNQSLRYATAAIQSACAQLGVFNYVLLGEQNSDELGRRIAASLPSRCANQATNGVGMVYEL